MTVAPDVLPIASTRQTFAWLRSRSELRGRGFVAVLGAGVVGAGAAVVPPVMLGKLIDNAVAHAPVSSIVPIAIVIVVSALVGAVATGVAIFLLGRISGEVLAELRERVVRQALYLPIHDLERSGKGDLLARTGNDVAVVETAARAVVPPMLSSSLLVIVTIVAMVGLDWRLGLAGMAAVPLYIGALRWYLPRSAPEYALERRTVAERSQVLVESMVGARTIHAYRLHDRQLDCIDAVSMQVRNIIIDVNKLFTRFSTRINGAEFAGLSMILVVGFVLVEGGASLGETTAAALLFHRLFGPIGALLYNFDLVQSAGASLARLVGVVDLPDRTSRPDSAQPADATLELRGVEFTYDGIDPVLKGIDLRIRPGERVALVGSTGAGKSTLAAIAAGMLRPSTGVATIGGVRLDEMSPTQLRRHVAIVTQEVHVFAGPLIEDLRLAKPDATVAEVDSALATVGASEWVAALADGADTVVGEGAHELTPARAQQLALARLVLADPPVCVLDEATAEAGSLGARELEQSAAAATAGRTTLVVAHRLTQAMAADRVVVLEHGSIVEEGAPADLVGAGGRFAQLWAAGLGRHRLADGR